MQMSTPLGDQCPRDWRSFTWCLVRLRWIRRIPILVTSPIGTATSFGPRVPLLEEHVGYIVAARFHDQSPDLPYLAVGRADGQFAAMATSPDGTELTVTSCGASGWPGPGRARPRPHRESRKLRRTEEESSR